MKRFLLLMSMFLLFVGRNTAQDSTVITMNYPPKDTTVNMTYSNLPLVWIQTSGVLSREDRILGSMKIINNEGDINYTDTLIYTDQNIEFDGPISIKWRGSSSFGYNGTQTKKPMSVKTLKTEDITGKKDKVKLLGMGKDSDWCFLAPWQDNSYIRDVITMEMAADGAVFSPQMRFCEVFMDGIYYGVYILSERATGGKQRLNLWDYGQDEDGNAIEDGSGDFHVEIDRPYNQYLGKTEPHYTSRYHPVTNDGTELTDLYTSYQYKEPDDEELEILTGARDSLHKAIDEMESAFYAENYKEIYGDYIDKLSFADYEIAQEVADNVDAYRLSTPLWKYSRTHANTSGDNDKWKLALWDFNIAYGSSSASYFQPNQEDWRYNANDMMAAWTRWDEGQLIPFYWHRLMADTAYVTFLMNRYTNRRQSNYAESHIEAVCDSLQDLLDQGAVARDNQAWNNRFRAWKTQITKVKSFAKNRLKWMDEQWYSASEDYRITVYFDNSITKWDKVYAYSWLNDSINGEAWPGKELTDIDYETETGGFYKASLPYSNVIFNDGTTSSVTNAYIAADGHIYNGSHVKGSNGFEEYVPKGNSLFFPSSEVRGNNVVIRDGNEYICANLVIQDNMPFSNFIPFLAQNVKYVRDMGNSEWGTIRLPFTLNSSDAIQYYSLQSVSDEYMEFARRDELSAGTPGIFRYQGRESNYPSDTADFSTSNVYISASTEGGWTEDLNAWKMIGTYEKVTDLSSADGKYIYFISGDKFWEAETPIYVNPFRAWFETSKSNQRARFLIAEAEENGIEYIESDIQQRQLPYDITGRIKTSKSGLLIKGGQIQFQK